MEHRQPSRRTFLTQTALIAGAAALGGRRAWAAEGRRAVVLLHLAGGNDGLNTVLPVGSEAYYRRRPTLAINARAGLPLAEGLAWHPLLGGLRDLWEDGQVAVIQGVGYPEPSASHFRSLEIWDSASDSDRHLRTGWLGRGLERLPGAPAPVSLGHNCSLALTGAERAPQQLSTAAARPWLGAAAAPAAAGRLAGDLARVAEALAGPRPAPAYHLTFGGFDTHARQAQTHAALLGELGAALHEFQTTLRRAGRADSVLTMVYSEFGRQLAENGTRGTDHGTAGPVFLLGGGVEAGLFGAAPDLDALEAGQLRPTVDFRQVYATVLERWYGLAARPVLGEGYDLVRCL